MKLTKSELDEHAFFIVPVGFQPMGTNQFTFTDTVSDTHAVRVGKNIFCTQKWHDSLLKTIK